MSPAQDARSGRPDAPTLRSVMSTFATGVAVVSTRSDERDYAVTMNSLTSVSLDPPLVLISVGNRSRFMTPLRAAGVWGVSILPVSGAAVAAALAVRGGAGPDLLDNIPHRVGDTGVALLTDALATLECRTRAIHPAGDHDLVIGDVVATSAPLTTSVTALAGRDEVDPLLFYRGSYGSFR
ncbi:MAG: flavin reductase family protein [Mobilicoccus sp.]|nr:flavin reductase family protein [Mobilicoccus sp.]